MSIPPSFDFCLSTDSPELGLQYYQHEDGEYVMDIHYKSTEVRVGQLKMPKMFWVELQKFIQDMIADNISCEEQCEKN